MPMTLWRGGQQLGSLHVRESPSARAAARRHVSALLLPSADAAGELRGVMQTRLDLAPGRPVMQHPLEPIIADEPSGPATRDRSRAGPVALHPASDAEGRGVAPDVQLHVRDGAGRSLGTRVVTLREFRPQPGTEAEVMAGYPDAALTHGRVWLVDVVLDADDVA